MPLHEAPSVDMTYRMTPAFMLSSPETVLSFLVLTASRWCSAAEVWLRKPADLTRRRVAARVQVVSSEPRDWQMQVSLRVDVEHQKLAEIQSYRCSA